MPDCVLGMFELDLRLMYVGMTRAMDELVITVSGSGPIGRAIQEAAC